MTEARIGKGTLLQRLVGASWTTVAEQVTIGGPNLATDDVEVTNHDSPGFMKEFIPGLTDAGEVTFEGNFIPGNITQQRLVDDQTGRVSSDYRIVWPTATDIDDRERCSFEGYVKGVTFNSPTPTQKTVSGTLKITGEVTFSSVYASNLTTPFLSVEGFTDTGGTAGGAALDLAPAAAADEYEYGASAANTVLSCRVTPTNSAAGTTLYVNDEEVDSGTESDPIVLAVGANSIVIKVTEDDKSPLVYSIVIVRARAA